MLLLSREPQLNPDMKSRILQIPYRNVSYAGISQDGNWLAFAAADDRGKFDVYMMNVSQGQPRRITNDSCFRIINVSLSPDAGTILYSRMRSTPLEPIEIIAISSLGEPVESSWKVRTPRTGWQMGSGSGISWIGRRCQTGQSSNGGAAGQTALIDESRLPTQ